MNISNKSSQSLSSVEQKLEVYQDAKHLVRTVYSLLNHFPKYEQYALCDQLRRAVVSIPSNIAEDMSRISSKEKAHFLEISYGSLLETLCQLEIAQEQGYITNDELTKIQSQAEGLAIKLSKFRKAILASK